VLEPSSTTKHGKLPRQIGCGTGEPPKKATGSRLAETLDRTLEPRVAPGKPGRPKDAPNYQWTPEMDKVLIELWTRYQQMGGLVRQGQKRHGETINGVVPARIEASKRQPSPRGETPHGFPGIIYWRTSQRGGV